MPWAEAASQTNPIAPGPSEADTEVSAGDSPDPRGTRLLALAAGGDRTAFLDEGRSAEVYFQTKTKDVRGVNSAP